MPKWLYRYSRWQARRVSRLVCFHRVWMAKDPEVTELDDQSLSVTWRQMKCNRCGKIRNGNILKSGEEIIVPWI